jgi:hypothetical protein
MGLQSSKNKQVVPYNDTNLKIKYNTWTTTNISRIQKRKEKPPILYIHW